MEKQIEALVKIRDACTMLSEGIDEYINSQAPKDNPTKWVPEKIQWQTANGGNGPYEKAVEQDGEDYKQLIQHLQQSKGKLSRNGLFYWLFDDKKTVGRKKSNR